MSHRAEDIRWEPRGHSRGGTSLKLRSKAACDSGHRDVSQVPPKCTSTLCVAGSGSHRGLCNQWEERPEPFRTV